VVHRFAVEVAGRKSVALPLGSKRFRGPVGDFGWVDMGAVFKRQPEDTSGWYLIQKDKEWIYQGLRVLQLTKSGARPALAEELQAGLVTCGLLAMPVLPEFGSASEGDAASGQAITAGLGEPHLPDGNPAPPVPDLWKRHCARALREGSLDRPEWVTWLVSHVTKQMRRTVEWDRAKGWEKRMTHLDYERIVSVL